ncbi:protease modulator HflC [Parvularcula sp. ZS-1/3]|uniref:Protein HflC n=1 Tax=Parvularcula mediterranea TaxID=2732508 RepID=A0A7Y3RKN1_9PROT|nr:protease modulator HflC [Parvularcula mediterranea]NNU15405.1 protease modulator HflC [Parvularcula mediterranea]
MMKNALYALIAFVIVGAFIASSALYTVREDQQALVLQFGDPVATIPASDAGLHTKTPILQNVVYFDAKNLNFDAQPVEVIVANEERLLVDAFVRYRIADPLLYFQRLSGTSTDPDSMRNRFNDRIGAFLNEAIRQVLGEVQIRDIITGRRNELMAAIQGAVSEEAAKLGVQIIDVRIRQADFPEANAANVYARMSSDYNQQAERIRADGERRALEIEATANKQVVQILAEAREQSQRVRGTADGERNAIFNEAYTRDPEFFAFYRSLLAYEEALQNGQGDTTIILSPDSEFFRYFNAQGGN